MAFIDLDHHHHRQVIVDREPGQYLGHPTTVLLEDHRTILTVYPKGHGKGEIVLKESTDGGLTWSNRLPVPESWATSKETPTIHRVVDADGNKRLILFSGLYPIRMAVSDDDGANWTELQPIGDFGGIVAMASVVQLRTGRGHYAAYFHDDGRFLRGTGETGAFQVFQTTSTDGGMTWSEPTVVTEHADAHLCEPGAVRSPDGRQIALLLRENSRKHLSFVVYSDDEGATWSDPEPLSWGLTGDRHVAKYAPDGRLVVTFRDMAPDSPTWGDWVAWIGYYDQMTTHANSSRGTDASSMSAGELSPEGVSQERSRKSGPYRVRLKHNTHGADCAYPGLELLPDGTFVTTTYGHWDAGASPYILSVRFRLDELDDLL